MYEFITKEIQEAREHKQQIIVLNISMQKYEQQYRATKKL